MNIKEIDEILARPDLDTRTRRVLTDVALVMRIHNIKDSTDVDKQELVALIQKEPIV
jgi:hypothetical protein